MTNTSITTNTKKMAQCLEFVGSWHVGDVRFVSFRSIVEVVVLHMSN